MAEPDTSRSIAVLRSSDATTYEALEPAARAFVDLVVDRLLTQDSSRVFEQLVEEGVIQPEVAGILRTSILDIFIHVRKLLVAAGAVEHDADLHGRLLVAAKDEFVKKLLSVQPSVQMIVGLSEDLVAKLAIISRIIGLTRLSGFSHDDLARGVVAVEELTNHLGRVIQEMALRIITAFVEREGGSMSGIGEEIKCERNAAVGFTVTVKVPRTLGEKGKQLSEIARELFPGIDLGIKFRGHYSPRAGGEASPLPTGDIEFTYDFNKK